MSVRFRSLSALFALIVASASAAANGDPHCRSVQGELLRTPSASSYTYRIRTSDGGFFIVESPETGASQLFEALKAQFGREDGPLRGSFMICVTGRNATDTYDGKPIWVARIKAYTPAASQ